MSSFSNPAAADGFDVSTDNVRLRHPQIMFSSLAIRVDDS